MFKLLFAIEKVTFKRNQEVYKQGEAANAFYIVYQGEFTAFKKIKLKIHDNETLNHFKKRRNSPNYHMKSEDSKESPIGILLKGQLFGVEDSFTEKPKKDKTKRFYSQRVVCTSEKARLLIFYK